MTTRPCLTTVRPLGRSIGGNRAGLVKIVEFDSYEKTMSNPNDPETAKYGAQMCEYVDGPVTFHNPDVRHVMQFCH